MENLLQCHDLPISIKHPGLGLLHVEVETLGGLSVQTGGGIGGGGSVQVLRVLHWGDQTAGPPTLL